MGKMMPTTLILTLAAWGMLGCGNTGNGKTLTQDSDTDGSETDRDTNMVGSGTDTTPDDTTEGSDSTLSSDDDTDSADDTDSTDDTGATVDTDSPDDSDSTIDSETPDDSDSTVDSETPDETDSTFDSDSTVDSELPDDTDSTVDSELPDDTDTTEECAPPEGWADYIYHSRTKWGTDGLYVFALRQQVPKTCEPSECYSPPMLDLNHVDSGGVATPVMTFPDASVSLYPERFDVSADGSRIAYPTQDAIVVADPSGTIVDSFDLETYNSIVLSSDGSRAVLWSNSEQIIVNVGGDHADVVELVTDEYLRIANIVWSPEGNRIAYTTDDPFADEIDLRVFDAAALNTVSVFSSAEISPAYLIWTADGTALIYAIEDEYSDDWITLDTPPGNLYRIAPVEGATPEPLESIYGAVSPQATRLMQEIYSPDWAPYGIRTLNMDTMETLFIEVNLSPICCK